MISEEDKEGMRCIGITDLETGERRVAFVTEKWWASTYDKDIMERLEAMTKEVSLE